VRERRVWLLGAAAVVGLVFALGENTPVHPALRKLIPQLSFITYPIKYISVAVFAAPLLAALALANWAKFKKTAAARRRFCSRCLAGFYFGRNTRRCRATGTRRLAERFFPRRLPDFDRRNCFSFSRANRPCFRAASRRSF
jgi:hypothetical protein